MIVQAKRGLALALIFVLCAATVQAAPYAALVMDARDGKVLHSRNADTRLHPASLTKMMTLYLVFDAVKKRQLSLDQRIPISRYAASKPPSKLGLRAGSSIELRYLVRASAVKSANDAAAAMAEAVSGSESAFAVKMTATARAMGMKNTTFKNASGLTQGGHLSTARDMALLGRRMFYDFPEYYNLFARRSTSAKIKTVYNTNRRLLNAYEGADGIKTGYTRAAGFNLVASAKRGQKRVIVSMFGGSSSAARNQRVAELMDLGFERMPRRKSERPPRRISVPNTGRAPVAVASAGSSATPARTARRVQVLRSTQSPVLRPKTIRVATASPAATSPAAADPTALKIAAQVSSALSNRQMSQITATKTHDPAAPLPTTPADGSRVSYASAPMKRPTNLKVARAPLPQVVTAPSPPAEAPPAAQAAALRNTGSWIVQLGGKHTRPTAERLLLTTALQEMEALEGSQRQMAPAGAPGWYHARFVGLSQPAAEAACARLAARQTPCQVMAGG